MAEIKIRGDVSGSTTIKAPDSGPDEVIELSSALGSKLDLAGGKILQIVRATDSTNRTTTSTSVVDANLSVTITPQKNNSAIILVASFRTLAESSAGSTENRASLRITDNSNNALSGAEANTFGPVGLASLNFQTLAVVFAYDTPATINATTYKARMSVTAATTTLTLQNAVATAQMYAIEVSA